MAVHKVIAPGVVGNDGTMRLSNRAQFIEQVADSFRGKSIRLIAEEADERMSSLWNYYFAVLVPLGANHFGYTEDEMHEAWKYEFNPIYFVDKRTGEEKRTGGTTTRLNKERQIQFVENCARHLAEEGLNVPPPIKRN